MLLLMDRGIGTNVNVPAARRSQSRQPTLPTAAQRSPSVACGWPRHGSTMPGTPSLSRTAIHSTTGSSYPCKN